MSIKTSSASRNCFLIPTRVRFEKCNKRAGALVNSKRPRVDVNHTFRFFVVTRPHVDVCIFCTSIFNQELLKQKHISFNGTFKSYSRTLHFSHPIIFTCNRSITESLMSRVRRKNQQCIVNRSNPTLLVVNV